MIVPTSVGLPSMGRRAFLCSSELSASALIARQALVSASAIVPMREGLLWMLT